MDTVKGLGILSVVVGHESRGLASSHLLEWTPAIRLADMWIYSFHMPLFFFLSGLFLLQSATKSSLRDFVSDKIRTLAYPYFVWSIITVVLKAALGQIPNHPRNLSDLLIIPYEPIEQFWFLYALFISVILLGTLFALGLRPWISVVLALIVYPGILLPEPGWSAIHSARLFAIYVAVGAFLGTDSFKLARRVEPQFLALTAALGLGLPALFITLNQEWVVVFALSGILGVIAVSLLLQRFHAAGFIDFLGQHALEIYVGHTIASAAARVMLEVFHIKSSEIHFIVGIGASLGIPLAIFYFFKIVGFQYGFTFPKRKPRLADALWHKIARLPLVIRTTNGKRVDSSQDVKK